MDRSSSSPSLPEPGDAVFGIGDNSDGRRELVATASLHISADDPQRFTRHDRKAVGKIMGKYGQQVDLVVDDIGRVIIGHAIYTGALEAGIEALYVRRSNQFSDSQLKQLSIAYYKMGQLGRFDQKALGQWLTDIEIAMPDLDVTDLGLSITEADFAFKALGDSSRAESAPAAGAAVARVGDLFGLGKHSLLCGDATDTRSYARLLGAERAAMVLTDPPYGAGPINGLYSKSGRHREFVQASGEMSTDELRDFFTKCLTELHNHSLPGAMIHLFIDWRSQWLLQEVARPLFGDLVNMAIWVKDRAGMGSYLRSQHELVLIYRVPGGPFLNNVELGRNGRNRTNVWDYPSAMTFGKRAKEADILVHHPTPKPVDLLSDAILDCTRRNDIVLDPFLGSGSTLVAAEKAGRRCFAIELDPLYVDLAIRRWQDWTGQKAIHVASGVAFDDLASDPAGREGAQHG